MDTDFMGFTVKQEIPEKNRDSGMNSGSTAVLQRARKSKPTGSASPLRQHKRPANRSTPCEVPTTSIPPCNSRRPSPSQRSSPSAAENLVAQYVDPELLLEFEKMSKEEFRTEYYTTRASMISMNEAIVKELEELEARALKAEKEVNEKNIRLNQLLAEKERSLVVWKDKEAELVAAKAASKELSRRVVELEASQTNLVAKYKESQEFKECTANSSNMALDHAKVRLEKSQPRGAG
ncbi:uncharacterized protein Fot_54241 [Forsythia ovata]|uniref:Uncharacterized protein n=1 Tax=Forsythia ovata TaxID=205694 RepID=A0ABD1PH75_9LAMI